MAINNQSVKAEPFVCRVCGTENVADSVFFVVEQVPVHCNVLWSTREEALQAPKGDIKLSFCQSCGHIFNIAFDPSLMTYTETYENSLHFSPRFRQYAASLADRLIDQYDVHEKDVIDVGCGKGDFLKLLAEHGNNRGVGFDRSYEPGVGESPPQGVQFVQDFYSRQHADYPVDLMTCLHVLEHIEYPREFMAEMRQIIGNRLETVVYFEVPNVLYTLRDLGIWDVIYEHCSYFSASSIAAVFTAAGFDVYRLAEAYGGQFLGIDARPSNEIKGTQRVPGNDLAEMAHKVEAFADNFREKVAAWRQQLENLTETGKKVVIWGAGSKGVTFLNIMQARDQIAYVVDINPRKQGRYVAGSGQEIVSPDFLAEFGPDVVFVMNPLYLDEIRQTVADMGLNPEFLTV